MNPIKVSWYDALNGYLAKVLGDDLAEIRRQVKAGVCELWQIPGHGVTITRKEYQDGQPSEFVFVAGRGQEARDVIRHFEPIAKAEGFKKLRIHSERVGMGRYLAEVDFYLTEAIYKKDI